MAGNKFSWEKIQTYIIKNLLIFFIFYSIVHNKYIMNKLSKKILIIAPFLVIIAVILASFKGGYLGQKVNSDEEIILDLENSGDCISAKSSCNICTRRNKKDIFICTDAVCQNESFYCIEHEKNNPNESKTDISEKDTKEASSEINLPQIPDEKLDSKTTLEIDNDKNKAKEKDRINAENLERAIKEISLKLDSPLPQMPNVKLDSKTVLGIDSNENGVRDVNEVIIYQGLNLLIGDKKIYYKVLRLIDMIEPASEEIIPNSKDEHEIYCSYKKLPSIVQKELPLRLIYSVVLDTQKRKTVFYKSTKSTKYNHGKEECE